MDQANHSIAMRTDDITKAGSYVIYYEVALVNYPNNKMTVDVPFKITLIKPHSEPRLSVLGKMLSWTFNVEVPTTTSVLVGTPYDPDGEDVLAEFSSGGLPITYNSKTGLILVDPSIKVGIYSLIIKLTDINPMGAYMTSYSILLKVTHPPPPPLVEQAAPLNQTDANQTTTENP